MTRYLCARHRGCCHNPARRSIDRRHSQHLATLRRLTAPATFDPVTGNPQVPRLYDGCSHIRCFRNCSRRYVRWRRAYAWRQRGSIPQSPAMQSGDGDLLARTAAGPRNRLLPAGPVRGRNWVCLINPEHPRLSKLARTAQTFTLAQYASEPHVSIVRYRVATDRPSTRETVAPALSAA